MKDLLKEIIAPVYDHGNTGFSYNDINNIKIVNRSDNIDTKAWLPSDKGAITLGSVVILKDQSFNQLMNPANDFTLTDLLFGKGTNEYAKAVALIVHEMVHVKQYRILGKDTFIINYLLKNSPIVTDGYGYGGSNPIKVPNVV